jgi:crossover junction endodeoxyribonuclease RuvC
MTLVLGIDPGLQRTGWGVIDMQGNVLRFVAAGVVTSAPKDTLAERLYALHVGVERVINCYHPQEAAMEETFVSVNASSTLKLGQARGALLLTLAMAKLPIAAYAATQVKKTIVGVGRAEKNQMIHMIARLLPGCNIQQADAADALAVAICHAAHRKQQQW